MNRVISFLKRPLPGACLALAALLFVVYGGVLFASGDRVLSDKDADLAVGIYILKFIFGELRNGNFPLWNPHLLSGYPMFASFQSMLLYPPAWIWTVLPLAKATDVFIVFHLWLLGAGMIWWMLRRGLHPVAAFVSGALLCFGSAGTMRVMPGHITPLAVIAWIPILLAIFDGVLESSQRRSTLKWVLGGVAIVALQIAAGFPQHFFYTALAIGIYFLTRVIQRAFEISSWRFLFSRLVCASIIYGWGILILSVQLLTSWQASKETARASALPFSFVSSFSFPPENFLTLIAPTFFGGDGVLPYWGRGYVWEMCLFVGVAGVLLAVFALLHFKFSRTLPLVLAVAVMLVLASGKHAFLLKFLYLHVPIFGGFRASSRALCQAAVFLCALAGLGLDAFIRGEETFGWRKRAVKFWPAIIAGIGFISIALSFWIASASAKPFWTQGFERIMNSRDFYLVEPIFNQPKAVLAIIESSSGVLLLAGTMCLFVAILMTLAAQNNSPRARLFPFALAAFCVFEVAYFAYSVRASFNLRAIENPKLEKFFAAQNDDDRFLKSSFDNRAMKWDANDVGGYESFRLRRYEEFINFTQGRDPDVIKPILEIKRPHPLYAMLRCRYFLNVETMQKTEIANVLPHVLLVNDARVLPTREAIFAAMKTPDFNPRQTVLLETVPSPRAITNTPIGQARLLESSTDHLIIEAETKTPAILLITDSYSRDWQAWGLLDENGKQGAQTEYSIQPANWTLRAIPLQAGKHKIRLEYLPRIFVIGKWISIVSLACFLIALVFALRAKPLSRAAIGE